MELLTSTIISLCETPKTEILVTIEHRTPHKAEEQFWDLLAPHFTVSKVTGDLDAAFVVDDIDLYSVRRKSE